MTPMMFNLSEHSSPFESYACRFLSVIADTSQRYPVFVCFCFEVDLKKTVLKSWSDFASMTKKSLQEYAKKEKCSGRVNYYAIKNIGFDQDVVYKTFWFMDAELVKKREDAENICALLSYYHCNMDKFSVDDISIHWFCPGEPGFDEKFTSFLHYTGHLIKQGCLVEKVDRQNNHFSTEREYILDDKDLLACLETMCHHTGYRALKSNVQTYLKKYTLVSLGYQPPTIKSEYIPNPSPSVSRKEPVTPLFCDPPVQEPGSTSVSTYQAPVTLLGMINEFSSILTRLETLKVSPLSREQKVIITGQDIYFGEFYGVVRQTQRVIPLNLNHILEHLKEVSSTQELARKFHVDEIVLRPIACHVVGCSDGSIQVKREGQILTYENAFYDPNALIYHQYEHRDQYKWIHVLNREVNYHYELDFVLHQLLKRDKGCQFFLHSLIGTIVQLCGCDAKTAAELRERFGWTRVSYQ